MSSDYASTIIDILRHGECEGGHIFRGSTDVALSKTGWQSMHNACSQEREGWDKIISSPLIRCRQFAQTLAQERGISMAVEDDLREMHFGLWEGRKIDDVWSNDRVSIDQWSRDPSAYSPPGGEALNDVFSRVEQVVLRIKQEYAGQKLLLVTHGGVIRVILAHILGMPSAHVNRFDIPYASYTRLGVFSKPSYQDMVKLIWLNRPSPELGKQK